MYPRWQGEWVSVARLTGQHCSVGGQRFIVSNYGCDVESGENVAVDYHTPVLEKKSDDDVSLNGNKNVILELIIVQNVQRPLIGTTKIVDWDELFEFYQQ